MTTHIVNAILIIITFLFLYIFHRTFPHDILVTVSCTIAVPSLFCFALSAVRCFALGLRLALSNFGTLLSIMATSVVVWWAVVTEFQHDKLNSIIFITALVALISFGLAKNKLHRLFGCLPKGANVLLDHLETIDEPDDVKIAVISDLHIPIEALLEGKKPREDVWKSLCDALRAACANGVDFIVVIGDVTDTGKDEEWEKFYEKAKEAGIDLDKIIIIPGNHDININSDFYPSSKTSKYTSQCYNYINNSLKRLALPANVIFDQNTEPLADVLEKFSPILEEFARDRTIKERYSKIREMKHETRRILASLSLPFDDLMIIERVVAFFTRDKASKQMMLDVIFKNIINTIFPIVIETKGDIRFVMLNSNTVVFNDVLNCGFGWIGKNQLKRLGVAIKQANEANKHLILLVHHFPMMVERTYRFSFNDCKSFFSERFLRLVDAVHLISELKKAKKCTTISGHLHYAYYIKTDDNHDYISVPSTCYGDDLGKIGKAYTVRIAKNGGVKIHVHT